MRGPKRVRLAGLAALVALVASAPGAAEPPAGFGRLRELTDLRRREAGAELRCLDREAERRIEEDWLARHGSPPQIERYRTRIRAEDSLDRLGDLWAARQAADAAEPGRFGPQTRRLLERSGIELRQVERRAESELRLDALEREAEERREREARGGAFAAPGPPFDAPPAAP